MLSQISATFWVLMAIGDALVLISVFGGYFPFFEKSYVKLKMYSYLINVLWENRSWWHHLLWFEHDPHAFTSPFFVFYLFDDPEVSGFFNCYKNWTGHWTLFFLNFSSTPVFVRFLLDFEGFYRTRLALDSRLNWLDQLVWSSF